jgi:Ca2+-transporting ATPase
MGQPLGLTGVEAHRRLAEAGRNILVPHRATGALEWILRLVADPMAILLLIAGGTYVVLGDRFDAGVTLGALVPIFLINAVLEKRADDALERLRALASPAARVLRDGVARDIPAEEIVPGDAVVIREGDVILADGRLVEGTRLGVDESALTGESLPVTRAPGEAESLLAGTTLLAGHGTMLVSATGSRTEYGRIGALMATIGEKPTPIETAIRRIVMQVSVAVFVVCAGVLAIDRFHGDAWPVAVIAAVSLAMAAVPEELPMVYTLYLALGAWRLARDQALVRRLSSVEALGAVDVICLDKTGTLTLGRLDVAEAAASPGSDRAQLLAAAVRASERDAFDPLDRALLRYARDQGVAVDELQSGTPVDDYPFDPSTRSATKVWAHAAGFEIVAKGAVEELVARVPLTDDERSDLLARNETLARSGMRVIAVARGLLERSSHERPIDERALRIAGLIGFADPIRPGVEDVLEECAGAGIRVVMITGDHPTTALAVARRIGICDETAGVLDGERLGQLGDAELARETERTSVFARIRPEQKLRIVRALHAGGHVVAMTGDGTNDALALRDADIGVAMGQRGTEVARSAARLVLLDDDIGTIARAIRDGRRIFENLRRAFRYLNAFHMPLLLSALIIPIAGLPLLLMPVHLVWLELIVHPTSSLVFESDPLDEGAMRRPPRPKDAPLLRGGDWTRPLLLGVTLTGAVLALYVWLLSSGIGTDAARAAAVLAMIAGQVFLVAEERSPDRPIWRTSLSGNRSFAAIGAATIASMFAAIYVPPVARLLHFAPPDVWHLAVALAAGVAATAWYEPLKLVRAATPAAPS